MHSMAIALLFYNIFYNFKIYKYFYKIKKIMKLNQFTFDIRDIES
jgi:hypothetical protein